MTVGHLMAGTLVCALLAGGCSEARRIKTSDTSRGDSLGSVVTASGGAQPGIRFDPAAIRRGDRVGDLVLDSIVAERTVIDSSYVGVARFHGEQELNGATMRSPDPDSRAVCFEVDAVSAARLPRWAGDQRRSWFCFENTADAARALGPASDGVQAMVAIDRFTIYRGLSDEVNSARFLRLRGDTARTVDRATP